MDKNRLMCNRFSHPSSLAWFRDAAWNQRPLAEHIDNVLSMWAPEAPNLDLIPLTAPEVRRLLQVLAEPPERSSFHLAWSR